MITVTWLDKRAMDAIEHHQRNRELNTRIYMRNCIDDHRKLCDKQSSKGGVVDLTASFQSRS